MSSFHRSDWLSLAQSVTTTVAVIAAFAVARYQHWLEQKSKRAEERKMLILLRDFIHSAYESVLEIDRYRSNEHNVETSRKRKEQTRDLAQRLDALNSIKVEALPDADPVRDLVRARRELTSAMSLIAAPAHMEAGDMPCGEPYGQRWHPLAQTLREVYESAHEMAAKHQ